MAKEPKRKTQNHSQDNTAKKRTGMAPKPYIQSTQSSASASRTLRSTTTKQASSSKAKGVIPIEQASTSKSNRSTTATELKIFCIVEKESKSFSVKILDSETVGDLKNAIKEKKKPKLDNIAADELTLWKVEIPNRDEKRAVTLRDIPEKQELVHERALLSSLGELTGYDTYIIVEPPQQVQKRSRDEETAESNSKRAKLEPNNPTLNAIELAGLTKKAVIDGYVDLSLLTKEELTSVLDNISVKALRTDDYYALSQTAATLRDSSFQDMDLISSPPRTTLPVIAMRDLYVRQAYKDLYDRIEEEFSGPVDVEDENHVVVTGTAGIGKSAFLVYFIIRILATSSEDNPPVIVFQEKESTKCYVFGGLSTVRRGDLEDFIPFLQLPETWYLVDSSPKPLLPKAKTIISASPKTLYSDNTLYQEIDKRIPWCYYMAPWKPEELELCRTKVKAFGKVSESLLKDLYGKIGGVPRYVLERPKKALRRNPRNIAGAMTKAYERVQAALSNVQDPLTLMQYFEQARDSLKHSSQLLHRWPTEDHEGFRLEWASPHVEEEVLKLTKDTTWHLILERLVNGKTGEAKGPMFELYARHLLRQGNWIFQARSLQGDPDITITLPPNPPVQYFDKIETVVPGTLCVPNSFNFPCVDMLLAPNYLLQVTINKEHGIMSEKYGKLLQTLLEKGWIESFQEVQMVFIVPQDIYDEYKEQHYLTKRKTVNTRVPQALKDIKQYVLGIDLRAACTGGSPAETTNNSS